MNKQGEPIAVILAAGVGRRLGFDGPKVLLSFGGRSLLQRHLENLTAEGVRQIRITVGHLADRIRAEVERLGYADRVIFVDNPRYTEGSLVSLAVQGEALRSGAPILLMDGDVLCDRRMFARLLGSPLDNTLLVDREFDPGDEPVKICFDAAGGIVDFRKTPETPGIRHGESVGFFRLSPQVSRALADRCEVYLAQDRTRVEYEEAIRDLLLADPRAFGAEDVTDLPWTEIDFHEDVDRARTVILPQLDS
jgi:choline kinase